MQNFTQIITEKRSSWIRGVDYYKGLLTLDLDGRMYSYWKVPPKVAVGLVKADSLGQYFNDYIKDLYDFKELL